MSEGTPFQRLPRHINPRKLTASGVSFEGLVDASELATLSEHANCSGDVVVSLEFSCNEDVRWMVSGSAVIELRLECQRCMQAIDARPVEAVINAAVVKTEEQMSHLPKALDAWLVEGEEADLYAFIEEEILLSLPVVAYHDFDCVDAGLFSSGDGEEPVESERESPFSVLSTLKSGENSASDK